jgi:single-strand DNA-binding protein
MIRASIHGRLGNDPVQRETRGGKGMATASLAVDAGQAGKEAVTEWISIVAFGALGEALMRCTKGDVPTALGVMTKSSFVGRDGQSRSSWSLLAEAVLSARGAPVRERRAADTATRPQRSRASGLYSAPKQPRASGRVLPDDGVDDLWPQAE